MARDVGQSGLVGVAGRELSRLVVQSEQAGLVLEAFARHNVPLARYAEQDGRAMFLFSLDDVPDWAAIKAKVLSVAQVVADDAVGAASVVGEGVGAASIARAKQVARELGVATSGLDVSPLRVTLYCALDKTDTLCRALHRTFVEEVPSA